MQFILTILLSTKTVVMLNLVEEAPNAPAGHTTCLYAQRYVQHASRNNGDWRKGNVLNLPSTSFSAAQTANPGVPCLNRMCHMNFDRNLRPDPILSIATANPTKVLFLFISL